MGLFDSSLFFGANSSMSEKTGFRATLTISGTIYRADQDSSFESRGIQSDFCKPVSSDALIAPAPNCHVLTV